MYKLILPLSLLLFTSCGGEKKTAEEISKEWCDLNKKVSEAKDEVTRDKAKEDLKAFSEKFDEDFKNDDAMYEKVTELTDECLDETEGDHHDYDGD
jgi:hypothetical protein